MGLEVEIVDHLTAREVGRWRQGIHCPGFGMTPLSGVLEQLRSIPRGKRGRLRFELCLCPPKLGWRRGAGYDGYTNLHKEFFQAGR